MNEGLRVGETFPVKSGEELAAEGLKYWEQRIATPVGIFLYDSENEWRDGHSRWVLEDGSMRVTTHNVDNRITEVRDHSNHLLAQ